MKLNYKLKVFLIAFVLGVFTNVTVANNQTKTEVNANKSDEWVEIKNENGIKISIQRAEENGKLHLNVKFENITKEKIEFSWTLMNRVGKVLFKNVNTIVQPTSGKNPTIKLVPIKDNTLSEDDCSISINIK